MNHRLKRRQLLLAAAGGLLGSLGARAEEDERPKFFSIPPQPTEDEQRIEVREFFYYGCGACYAFEPYLRQWEERKGADVQLVRTPALRNTLWIPLTMVYFVLLKLGAQERLHQEVFDAYHFDNADLGDINIFSVWAEDRGLDRARVRDLWKSREVAMAVELTQLYTRRYGVQGVPTLVVDGRYLTSPSLTGGAEQVLAVVDELVARRRQERGQE